MGVEGLISQGGRAQTRDGEEMEGGCTASSGTGVSEVARLCRPSRGCRRRVGSDARVTQLSGRVDACGRTREEAEGTGDEAYRFESA